MGGDQGFPENANRVKKSKKTTIYKGFWSKKLGMSDDDEDWAAKKEASEGKQKEKEEDFNKCCLSACCKGFVVGPNKPRSIQ